MSDSVLQEAERFLHPVLSRGDFVRAKTVSVVDKLFEESPVDLAATDTKADVIVGKGLLFLEKIQQTLLENEGEAKLVLETPALRRTIDALLDLVSLEGTYPRLLSGVGAPIERRVQSVLHGGISIAEIKDQNNHDDDKLALLVDRLYVILISDQGIASIIQQRTLVDILAALLQLAYGPLSQQQHDWSGKFSHLINSLSPTILFPSLISLLHTTTPSWLKPHVTVPLSLLPMRADGVRQTITFVAKSTPQRPSQNVESDSHTGRGPSLPLEVLNQISKVLSSVPSTVTTEEYFDGVAPQLYALLEDQDPDAQRAAAYTISHGILSKRVLGAPGTVGWKYFVQPLLVTIDPSLNYSGQNQTAHLERGRALRLLDIILSEFPNPALSKRLLGSIVLPLWQISCSTISESMESKTAIGLLKLYFHTVIGSKGLSLVADNLMVGADGQRTTKNELVHDMSLDTDELSQSFTVAQNRGPLETAPTLNINEATRRTTIFMDLVKACPTDIGMGEFFAVVLKVSLQNSHAMHQANNLSEDSEKYFSYTYIAQAMIREMGLKIMANAPIGLLVVEEVLRSQISTLQSLAPNSTRYISRSNLEAIMQGNEAEDTKTVISDLENTLSICLPWLTVVLQQETSSEIDKVTEQIVSVQSLLETFLHAAAISRTTKQALRSTIALLSEARNGRDSPERIKSVKLDEDVKLHASALKNLQATEIPIRVQGLSELERLVLRGSSLVSVSSAVLTVLALLQDQDSFVYLSAVKTLVNLAKEDPLSTVKTLQEAYQDITEQSTIDVRLRIGEAIQTIIEELGNSLPAPTIISLVELLLYMSSRRSLRRKAGTTHSQTETFSSTKHQEHELESDLDLDTDEIKAERDAETVLKSWQGKFGAEDLRLRTSSLTILGTVFEHAKLSTMTLFFKPTLDLIFKILNEEKGQENAIIRRAGIITVLSMVKGVENSHSDAVDVGFNAKTEDIVSLQTVDTLFTAIASEDEDEIVRGHAEELVKAIQDWREESFTQLLRGDTIKTELADDDGNVRLRGIDLNLGANTTVHNTKQQRVEELD